MSIEMLAGLKGMRTPPGMGSRIANWWRRKKATPIQIVGPTPGVGVTSYILQLVQQGILDTEVVDVYNEGKSFTSMVQANGIVRKLGLRDIPVDDEEERFLNLCADYIKRKPIGVVWIAPGRQIILKEKENREEYAIFRKYVQFLMADTFPLPGGKDVKTVKPAFILVAVNHMDEYERIWQVNFFDYLHYYRKPLSYIRKKHRDVKVVTVPCCCWAGINVREPLINVLTSLLMDG